MNDRHIKWILLASLLINAAGLGYLAGHVGRGGFGGPGMMAFNRGGPENGPGNGPGNGQGNPNNRAAMVALRAALDAERPTMDKALKDLADARMQSAGIIRAETLNGPELDKSLEQIRASSLEALASFHRSVAAAAAKLDAPQRGLLARFLDRARQNRANPLGALGPPGAALRGGPRERQIERLQGGPPPGPPPGAPPPQ